jgi:hypothetical protein
MKKTYEDLRRVGSTALNISKKVAYYGYIPLIIILGLRTVNFDAMIMQQGM